MERTDIADTDAPKPWVLVVTGTQTYIGQCLDWGGNQGVLSLAPAYRVHEVQMPVEVGPGKVGMQMQVIVKPPFLCLHPVPVVVEPSAVVLLDSMHPDDATRWRRMVEAADREQQAARALASGITLASAMPRA